MMPMEKYPRTRHIEGSRLQPGDGDLAAVPLRDLANVRLVIEEKVDGANCAISFDHDDTLLLQSRGHYLTGGLRERQFGLLKSWATRHQAAFRRVLGRRYVMFGEWLYAKHTVFYDALPHYFLEFDIWDREQRSFLATPERQDLLGGLPVVSVRVIAQGTFTSVAQFVAPSAFKTDTWRDSLRRQSAAVAYAWERALHETDPSDDMEGLYIKWEEEGVVRGRYKYVRAGFLSAVLDSGSHWQDRPVIPNLLRPGVDLFA